MGLFIVDWKMSTVKMINNHFISFTDVKTAYRIIKPVVHLTPLLQCNAISEMAGKSVFLKAENLQKTGSFKIRGATNALAHIAKMNDVKCVVTHSSGNHGQAVAKAAQLYSIPSYIVMPTTSPNCKKEAVKSYGGNVIECPPTERDRVQHAEQVVKENLGVFIHASQDPLVAAGQGTIAMEMLEQNPNLDAIIAPVGGGGMISGIAVAAKALKPAIKVYAAEPEVANDCYLSKINGKRTPLAETPVTIADGVKVNIGENSWPIIHDLVDDVVTVSELEIKRATVLVWERAKMVIEPTSGVGVAALIGKNIQSAKGYDKVRNIGVVLCGGNVDLAAIVKIVADV